MILQYVDAHGQITRAEAAELCSLTPDQASRLLRRLAEKGKLKLRGERRDRNMSDHPDEAARKHARSLAQ
jgi:DeoR/GlpR family transcriptional regulator of sugar metabolism